GGGLGGLGGGLLGGRAVGGAGGFLSLAGKRTLLRAAARRGRCAALLEPPLALGLLLLPARQLLQLLKKFIDLTVAIRLHLAIGGFVAARHLFEFLLQDVGALALLGGTSPAPTPRPLRTRLPPATLLRPLLH